MNPVPAPLPVSVSLPAQTRELAVLFWDWIAPACSVLLASAAAIAVGRSVALLDREDSHSPRQTLRHAARAGLQALTYVAVLAGALYAGRSVSEDRGTAALLHFGLAVALLWAGFVALDFLGRQLQRGFQRQGRPSAATVVPLLDKIAKAAWALLVGLAFLDNMGFNVKALLAGLGVGGLAVALAGQKTIENLFGGLMLVLDQPVRTGDYCSFGTQSGQVLEVGLRSVKLRTDARTVITVPNGQFSELILENFARRDRIRFDVTLALRLDTGAERLEKVLAGLDAALKADPGTDPGMDRYARLVKVNTYSLDVEVFCYYRQADWDAFLLWRQSFLLGLLQAVEREGARLAFPVQITVPEKE